MAALDGVDALTRGRAETQQPAFATRLRKQRRTTYVWVPADGLDGLVVKVTRVTSHAADDVVCVLEAVKDVGCDGELRPLSQLHALVGALGVDALHPVVVLLGAVLLDVLLEDDHVRVGHLLCLC
jgi:hypothetical protein